MFKKSAASVSLWIVVGLVAISAVPAKAHVLAGASATVNCTGYDLTVTAKDLSVGHSYTIDYSFNLTPTNGGPAIPPVHGSIAFVASATTATETASGNWLASGSLTASYKVTGTATLTISGSTKVITFGGSTSVVLTCTSECPGAIVNELGEAGPSNFTILSLGGSNSQVQFSSGTVQGNAGVPNSGHYNESGSSILTGALYLGSSAALRPAAPPRYKVEF
jgi:hypothetical protein